MAKRKRLTGPLLGNIDPNLPQTPQTPPAPPATTTRAPIADVAGQASATAALHQVVGELDAAKRDGRMVLTLPLDQIVDDHLIRDRVALDGDEMASLQASLQSRGQQTPIEVVQLGVGSYGLISGYRRVTALRALGADGSVNADGPGSVLALVRQPNSASDAYTAMVEENEIRVGLSYFERASIVRRAAQKKVFPSEVIALQTLFASASRSKRSKIKSFISVVTALGDALHFPLALSERQGLALATQIQSDPGFGARLRDRLRKADISVAQDETAVLARALDAASGIGPKGKTRTDASQTKARPQPDASQMPHFTQNITANLQVTRHKKGVDITGDGVNDALVDMLLDVLRNTAK